MNFIPTPLSGAYLIELVQIEDERGFFARAFCREEFIARGLSPEIQQCNVSWNRHKGTLRGLHFQAKPHEEAKLVRCTRGAIWDVIVDLREGSSTKFAAFGVRLDILNRRALYVPEGFAHGFQTLEDDSEVLYHMSVAYKPNSACGVRWDDPKFGIVWPLSDPILSDRDRAYPLLS